MRCLCQDGPCPLLMWGRGSGDVLRAKMPLTPKFMLTICGSIAFGAKTGFTFTVNERFKFGVAPSSKSARQAWLSRQSWAAEMCSNLATEPLGLSGW